MKNPLSFACIMRIVFFFCFCCSSFSLVSRVAKVTSPETYHNPSCQTAEKSQDSRSKGQDSEVHLNRSGHDYSVVAAPGLTPARQEHATTTAAVPEVVSAKHSEICEYRR